MKRALILAFGLLAAVTGGRAQLVLSGVVLYSSYDDGAQRGAYWWETNPGGVGNVYLFTGSPGAPNFLNSGDLTLATYNLTEGEHTIYFAANYDPSSEGGLGSHVGLNFFFDANLTNNRISIVGPTSGSSSVNPISSSVTTTYGNYGLLTGAGTDSFTSGGLMATVSSFQVVEGAYNLVGYTSTGPSEDGFNDVVGRFTLTVAAVPEPTTGALWCGLTALGLARWRRWRRCAAP